MDRSRTHDLCLRCALLTALLGLSSPLAIAQPSSAADPAPASACADSAPAVASLTPSAPRQTVLRVLLHETSPAFTAAEVVCRELGFRQRVPFTSVRRLPSQPTEWRDEVSIEIPDGDCALYLKGGYPYHRDLQGGGDLFCTGASWGQGFGVPSCSYSPPVR